MAGSSQGMGRVSSNEPPTHPPPSAPKVGMTAPRRTLYTKDAQKEIDSSFIRRLHVQSVVGLPLVAGDTLVGLLYLDFCAKPGQKKAAPPLDAAGLAELERE